MLLAQTHPTQLSHTGLQQLRQKGLLRLPGVPPARSMFDWHKMHLRIQTPNHQKRGGGISRLRVWNSPNPCLRAKEAAVVTGTRITPRAATLSTKVMCGRKKERQIPDTAVESSGDLDSYEEKWLVKTIYHNPLLDVIPPLAAVGQRVLTNRSALALKRAEKKASRLVM